MRYGLQVLFGTGWAKTIRRAEELEEAVVARQLRVELVEELVVRPWGLDPVRVLHRRRDGMKGEVGRREGDDVLRIRLGPLLLLCLSKPLKLLLSRDKTIAGRTFKRRRSPPRNGRCSEPGPKLGRRCIAPGPQLGRRCSAFRAGVPVTFPARSSQISLDSLRPLCFRRGTVRIDVRLTC